MSNLRTNKLESKVYFTLLSHLDKPTLVVRKWLYFRKSLYVLTLTSIITLTGIIMLLSGLLGEYILYFFVFVVIISSMDLIRMIYSLINQCGHYFPPANVITVVSKNPRVIWHEIGHALDYQFWISISLLGFGQNVSPNDVQCYETAREKFANTFAKRMKKYDWRQFVKMNE